MDNNILNGSETHHPEKEKGETHQRSRNVESSQIISLVQSERGKKEHNAELGTSKRMEEAAVEGSRILSVGEGKPLQDIQPRTTTNPQFSTKY